MSGIPPGWPHDRYRKRPRTVPESARPRLAAIHAGAMWVRRAIEELMVGSGAVEDAPSILVVEDDRSSRAALGTLFARRGWDVVAVGTVADGLSWLDPPPDCLLLDLMLPDGHGESILEAVRARGLASRVVVTTGVEDPGRLDAVARLGPDSLLQKPVELEDLCRACRGVA